MHTRAAVPPSFRICGAAILLAAASVSAQTPNTAPNAAPNAERIADGVVRFWDVGAERDALALSVALLRPLPGSGPVPEGFRATPRFIETDEGKKGVWLDVEPGTSLYGTGEAAGPLRRNGRVIDCWNFDAYGYDDSTPHLYQSHPWVLGVRADGTSFGLLADTTYRVRIDLTGGISMISDGPDFPAIVIERDTPQQVVATLAELTGKIEMPPRWALGYHQCRYSYYPDARVREIAEGFRARSIPADVIWMDIDYMDAFRVFTFNREYFPDPAALNAHLDSLGFSNVWMIDPGVKKDPGYPVYDSGEAAGVWVNRADGSTYVGEVWPGDCVFPDFTRAHVREWWAGFYKDFMALGVDGVWNDMNEPAVFNVQSKTMPLDNRHDADPELGGPGDHARYHNIYGMQMVRATRDGVMAANPHKRPFVLSRANFMGGQRYAATWSGDNSADWYHLESSVPMVINLGLSGNPFTGPDIGGFAGNGDASLFARWMGVGSLLPFARGHTGKGNIDKEPWAFGPEVEATCRRALERRYRLLPYLYTLFYEAHTTGMPIARPLFFLDPKDPGLRAEDDAFLLGGDLMVVADLSPARDRLHALPADFESAWRALDLGDSNDPDLPRLHLRAGAVLPMGPVMQHTGERELSPVTLFVALDKDGRASGLLYEDAGEGWGFKVGQYRLTRYDASRDGDVVTITPSLVDGKWELIRRPVVVHVITSDGRKTAQGADGLPIRVPLR